MRTARADISEKIVGGIEATRADMVRMVAARDRKQISSPAARPGKKAAGSRCRTGSAVRASVTTYLGGPSRAVNRRPGIRTSVIG